MRAPSSSPDLPDQIPFVGEALARIKGMFGEMPGTEWTVTDAARLSGLENSVCRAILDALRHAGFLTQRADGSYVQYRMFASGGPVAVSGGSRVCDDSLGDASATFRLIGVSRRLEAGARAAQTDAARLDNQEAPRREVARAVAEAERKTAAAEKTRTINKSEFRP